MKNCNNCKHVKIKNGRWIKCEKHLKMLRRPDFNHVCEECYSDSCKLNSENKYVRCKTTQPIEGLKFCHEYKVIEEKPHDYLIMNENEDEWWYKKEYFSDFLVDNSNMETNIDKSKIHAEICKELNNIYIKKNADYGDSFANARKEIKEYTLGKLYEKYERFKKLGRSGNQVKNETIEDALIDLANYAIMELLERRINK